MRRKKPAKAMRPATHANEEITKHQDLNALLARAEAQKGNPQQLLQSAEHAVEDVAGPTEPLIPSKTSRLLDLPAELRNRIYELVLCSTRDLQLPSFGNLGKAPDARQPALTRVARQVRTETLSTFYCLNDFNFYLHRHDFSLFLDFVSAIGSQNCRSMRSITIIVVYHMNCGEGLLDFVSWCANTEAIQKVSIRTAHPDHEATRVYFERSCKMLRQAIVLANELREAGETSEQQLKPVFHCVTIISGYGTHWGGMAFAAGVTEAFAGDW